MIKAEFENAFLSGAKNVVHNSGFKSDADLVILAAKIGIR